MKPLSFCTRWVGPNVVPQLIHPCSFVSHLEFLSLVSDFGQAVPGRVGRGRVGLGDITRLDRPCRLALAGVVGVLPALRAPAPNLIRSIEVPPCANRISGRWHDVVLHGVEDLEESFVRYFGHSLGDDVSHAPPPTSEPDSVPVALAMAARACPATIVMFSCP